MNTRIQKCMAALSALLLLFSCGCGKAEENTGPVIGYATEGVTAIDGDELSRQVQKMMEESQDLSINLSYKPEAFSLDGINFSCYLGNPADNPYDMYIQIVGDAAGQDVLFLSGLIRPGEAFENITLNHALKPGRHTVDCTFTLVETAEDGTQSIYNQATMEIYLNVEIA